jgi:hypothetical protein
MTRLAIATLATAVTLLVASPLSAQVATGRQRPAPPPEAADQDLRIAPERRWFFMTGAGVMTGGDLLRITLDGTVGFDPPGGPAFESRDFTLTMDEGVDLAVAIGYRLHERWWLRANLSTAQVDLTALAQVGQGSGVYRWDQLNVVATGLDTEFRLIRDDSYPYLVGGAMALLVNGVEDDGYDQTALGIRFGGGYQQALWPDWGLRLEIRNNLASLDFADYRPPVTGPTYPNLTVETKSPQHFWEILLLLQGGF